MFNALLLGKSPTIYMLIPRSTYKNFKIVSIFLITCTIRQITNIFPAYLIIIIIIDMRSVFVASINDLMLAFGLCNIELILNSTYGLCNIVLASY